MGRQKDRRSPAGAAKAPTYKVLNALLARANARGMPDAVEGRVRTALAARIAAAEASGQPSAELCDSLASGAQALALAEATREQIEREEPELFGALACTSGCAWCCIFLEGDGGLISEAEAVALHTALSPFAGTADGRNWHPEACAALDPATRLCRAYDARPMICRTFVSTDAGACRENAEGGDADGSGTIGSHVDYLTALALSREALKGRRKVSTYNLQRLAIAAAEGTALAESLAAARHGSAELPRTCEDFADSI